MGSGNSRQSGWPPKVNRCKHRLTSLFCGSSSHACSSQRRECRFNSCTDTSPESSCRNIQQLPRDRDSLIQSSCLRNEITADSKLTQHQLRLGDIDSARAPSMGHSTQPLVGLNVDVVVDDDDDDVPSIFDEVNHTESCPTPAVSVASDPGIANQSPGNEAVQDRIRVPPEGSLFDVDVVSVSSTVLPHINSEAAVNSRTMFTDAFPPSLAEYPALRLTTEDADFMRSRRRWLLDIGDDVFDQGFESSSLHLGRRSRLPTDHRQNSRSEFWDRLRGAAIDSRDRVACPLDLHSHGSCTCELEEEASALSSISRIVLLAEALFEVLDEIHRQPDSFLLSVLSIPSPESVVDLLPLRTYEKLSTTGSGEDVDQCYICLVEYEEGDKIRILPCRHEYHMSCVDKWLKEIHGICPLCRGEVRGEVLEENAASSADAVVTYAA